jgi:hypothetical protein
MWGLQKRNGHLLGSLAWERYVPTVTYVHGYGCRLASGMNEKKKKDGILKEKHRHSYCGAYQLTAGSIRSLSKIPLLNEVTSADVVHHIEEGEISHTDLRISLKPDANEGTKTVIVDRLWHLCSGPVRHICESDHDMTEHPNARLINGPLGPYADTRSPAILKWCLFRFKIFDWSYRTSTAPRDSNSLRFVYRWWHAIKFRIAKLLFRLIYRE